MAADTMGRPAADGLPLDRDPSRFPFGLLLVAPGLFEAVSGFNWFTSEADALDFLREGVWHVIDLPEAHKQEGRLQVASLLTDGIHLDDAVIGALGAAQENLNVVWAGEFEGISNGSDEFVLELLRDTAFDLGNPRLADTPEGRIHLLSAYRWQYTGGVGGLRSPFGSLAEDEQIRFLDALDSAHPSHGFPAHCRLKGTRNWAGKETPDP